MLVYSDSLRCNCELDVVVVCIYHLWSITAVPSWVKGKTPFNTRRSYFTPISKGQIREDRLLRWGSHHRHDSHGTWPLLVEVPGTAPGSAIPN